MATTANFNGVLEALLDVTKLRAMMKFRKKATTTCCFDKRKDKIPERSLQATRRLAIGLASVAIFGNADIRNALAEDNGFWITTPIPVPYANNKINNEETGTRSFLKKGIYIANIGTKGRIHRLKRYAFDLIALGDLIAQRDAWNYVRKYLRLKSTFMYFDFDEVISAAPVEDKQTLTDLANKLFDSVEKLLVAVKEQNVTGTDSIYQDTTSILQEVMVRMA